MWRCLGTLLAIGLAQQAVAKPVQLAPVSFSDLANWHQQAAAPALQAFRTSCAAKPQAATFITIDASRRAQLCNKASGTPDHLARHFFEAHFVPHRVREASASRGLLTGYYVPLIEGTLERHSSYPVPVYGVPKDWRHETEYHTRKEIESGKLSGRGLEVAWVKDAIELFFLQIQGSGRMRLPDGKVMNLQYAAKNNRNYTAIGKVLVAMGEMQAGKVTMQGIKGWLRSVSSERARQVMQKNDAYIFFKAEKSHAMPKGAQGVPLTPHYSLAADRTIYPYGTPVFLQAEQSEGRSDAFSRLAIVQDTGSAIRGAMRGDLFVGEGAPAEALAGKLAAPVIWYVLLPKGAPQQFSATQTEE